jgi:uncharacterized membrane protein (DUF485 family)
MKIKILKTKHQDLNSKSNGLHFVEFIQTILLVVYCVFTLLINFI